MNIIRRSFRFIYRLSLFEKVFYGFLLVILLQVAQVVFDWLVKVFKELITWILSNSVTISAIIVSLLLFGTGCFLYFKRWKSLQQEDEDLEDEEYLEDENLLKEDDANQFLSIYTGRNYNENIGRDYLEIHGHQINIHNDFTQLSKEIRNLVEYLKSKGYKQEDAEEEIIQEIEEKTLHNPKIRKTLRRIRKSLNKNNSHTSYRKVVKEVDKTATSYSYTNSKDFTDVIGEDLHALNELLQSKKWKEADKKTTEIILAIGHKHLNDIYGCYKTSSSKYIVKEHIKVIPNNYLKDIDNYWIEHSNGRFGFSIQKDILQKIIQDKQYTNLYRFGYKSPIVERFGDLVGLRKEGQWLHYVDLYDSLEIAAIGHLPLAYMLRSNEIDKCDIDIDILDQMIDRRTIF